MVMVRIPMDEQQIALTERQPDGSWRIVKVVTSQAEADEWMNGGKVPSNYHTSEWRD